MSTLRLAASLAGLTVLAAAGCGGPEEFPGPEPVGQGITWEQYRAQAYLDPEGVFVVDGDVAIHDETRLREFFETYVKDGQLIVHTSGGVDVKWDDTQKLNLTYCVSTTGFTSLQHGLAVQALADAASAWEAVANVNFIYKSDQDATCTASNNNVVFDVRPVNSGGAYYVRAFFPDTPRSARNILIDTSAFGSIAPLTLTGLLRHEMGHVLGFGHEHIRPAAGATDPNCFEDAAWRELTSYDPASVMHFPSCNGTGDWSFTLSALDGQGAAALYGLPGTQPPPEPGPGTPTSATASGTLALGQSANHGPYDVVANSYFKVVMSGTGNPDLYVSFGTAPTATSFYCRPALSGASETCNVLVPEGQTKAYIMVKSSNTATYSLSIDYTRPSATGGPASATASGTLALGQSANHGPYDVVANSYFKVVMSGTGNPDLYVSFGTAPTATSFYCRPALSGASETCNVLVPPNETKAYVMVKGTTSATYSLDITYVRP